MIYPIVVYGHPVLRNVAEPIDANYEGLSDLIKSMWETMYEAEGLGLAAPQIGLGIRLFVIDGEPLSDQYKELRGFKKVFINPVVELLESKEEWYAEGCLSLPGLREEVKRPTEIRITYQDQNFVTHVEVYEGFAARVIQHEYDHIEGKLFVDYLSPLKRRLLKGKLSRISKGEIPASYTIKVAGA